MSAPPSAPGGESGVAEGKLAVIRKLLAKAERAATEAEAQAYNAKAAELMARHGVDAALLAASGEQQDAIGRSRIVMTDPYSAEKAVLACWIAAALRCRAVQHRGEARGRVAAVTLIGFDSDRARVELLFTSLLLQAARTLTRQRPTRPGESVAAFRRSWLRGFAAQVHHRLRDAEATAAEDAEDETGPVSTALVLAGRSQLVEAAYAEAFPGARHGRAVRRSGSGYSAGAAAGARAHLGQGGLDPAPQRALDR